MARPYYSKTDSPWYRRMKEVGQHLQESFRVHRKIKYITLCSCGDLHSTTNKEGARYHTSAHQFSYRAEYLDGGDKHTMQTFKETDIW